MKLAELHGPVLSGRTTAIALRTQLQEEFAGRGVVVLDFEDVETMSPSFADELFDRFVDEIGEDHVEMANLSPHLSVVADIVRRRSRA